MNLRKTIRIASIAFGMNLIGGLAAAQSTDSVETLAERLIALRTEVDDLQGQIESERQAHRNRLNGLAQRRASLESEIQSKQLTLRQLQKSLGEQREKTKAANASAESMSPVVDRVAEMIRAYVQGSLPFQTEDRLKSVDEVKKKVASGDLTAPRALNRLWGLVDDEMRLTKENGLFRQEVVIDGQAHLSDVIRLGTMALFFQTGDGQMGWAIRKGDGFDWKLADGEDAELIENLFSSFEKQVRTGFFEIPNAIVRSGR